MAEICADCLEKTSGINNVKKQYRLSDEPDFCEFCGEVKPVVVAKSDTCGLSPCEICASAEEHKERVV